MASAELIEFQSARALLKECRNQHLFGKRLSLCVRFPPDHSRLKSIQPHPEPLF